MLVSSFDNSQLSGSIYLSGPLEYTIKGSVKEPHDFIIYEAASPAESRYSYAGSGLPFPNPDIAFQDTPNKGKVMLNDLNEFNFKLKQPNSFYIYGGQNLLKPHVNIYFPDKSKVRLELGDSIPNKSLTSLPGRPPRALNR